MVVAIFDNGKLIDQADCRIVLLPDGRQAAIWRGLAYPMHPDQRIEPSGEAFLPGECRDPVHCRWTTTEGADPYLVIEGSILDAERAAAIIRQKGALVARVGRYFGDPVHELSGDWFVKFERPDVPNTEDWLAGVLGPEFEPSAGSRGTDPKDLRISVLTEALSAATRHQDDLRDRLAAAVERLARREDSLTDQLNVLRAELEAERAERDTERTQRAKAEKKATDTLDAAQQRRTATVPAPKLKNEVETVLASLLSRIELVRDSLMFVSLEMSDRGPLYRALAELNFGQDRMPPAWKKVQGANGWWERHVSSGHDDAGRVYARLDPSTRRWQALVSHKGDQPRDMHWLARQ
jgi:hypothetical protein